MLLGKLPVPGVLLIWIIARHGLGNALTADGGGACLDIFYLVYHCSLLSPSLSGKWFAIDWNTVSKGH